MPAKQPSFYQLRCVTCKVKLQEVSSDTKGELLERDWEALERCEEQAGKLCADALRKFFEEHGSHEIEEILV